MKAAMCEVCCDDESCHVEAGGDVSCHVEAGGDVSCHVEVW